MLQEVTLAISSQQSAFCNEDLHWLDINAEDVNDELVDVDLHPNHLYPTNVDLHYKMQTADC
jgi:hypothetical protein